MFDVGRRRRLFESALIHPGIASHSPHRGRSSFKPVVLLLDDGYGGLVR